MIGPGDPTGPGAQGPGTGPAPLSDADLWESLARAGVQKDSAAALVRARGSVHPADLWERAVASGGDKDAVTAAIRAMGSAPAGAPAPSPPASQFPLRADYAPGAGESAAVHAADQFTLGLGNKFAALMLHLKTGAPYADIRAAQQAALDRQEQLHPAASTTGDLVGGIASPVNYVLPGAGEAAGVGRTALAAGAQGALSGGAEALGHSDGSIADRAKATAIGTGVGGATGGLLSGALSGVKGVVLPLVSSDARLAQAAAASGGVDALRARAAALAAAGRGAITAGADLSPQMRATADAAATANPAAHAQLAQSFMDRQQGMAQRVIGDVQQAMGAVSSDAGALKDKLTSSLQSWANKAYAGLRGANPDVNASALQDQMGSPEVNGAWAMAKRAGAIAEGDPLAAMMAKVRAMNPNATPADARAYAQLAAGDHGLGGADQPVSYGMLQDFRKILDDKVTSNFNQGNGNLANAFKTVRDAADNVLSTVPGHDAVSAEYAARKGVLDAVADGEKAWDSGDPRDLARLMPTLPPAAQQAVRSGIASKLVAKLENSATNKDVATQLANMSAAQEQKLGIAFGDKPTLDAFIAKMEAERALSSAKGVSTGSQTASRLMSQAQPVAGVTALLGAMQQIPHAFTDPRAALAHAAMTAIPYAAVSANRATMGRVGATLAEQGPDAIQSLLARITAAGSPAALHPAVQAALAGGAGQLGGRAPGLLSTPGAGPAPQ